MGAVGVEMSDWLHSEEGKHKLDQLEVDSLDTPVHVHCVWILDNLSRH